MAWYGVWLIVWHLAVWLDYIFRSMPQPLSFRGLASGNRVHVFMVVSMYLSDGGLITSTQIVENGVLIKGSFPIGAFGTVPFDTFRWHKSHEAKYLVTHVHLANRTLVELCSKFWPPLYVLPIMYRVQLTQPFLSFQWDSGHYQLNFCVTLFTRIFTIQYVLLHDKLWLSFRLWFTYQVPIFL